MKNSERFLNFLIDSNSNAKWILNIKWEMQGIDVHLDTNIGKRLSALGDTLTSLTGEEDEDFFLGDEPDGRHDVSLEDVSEIQVDISMGGSRMFCQRVSNFDCFFF